MQTNFHIEFKTKQMNLANKEKVADFYYCIYIQLKWNLT